MGWLGCCNHANDVYCVQDGSILVRREFHSDSPTDWRAVIGSGVSATGRGDNGHFVAAHSIPTHRTTHDPGLPQDGSLDCVRAWDGGSFESRWSWSASPNGVIVPYGLGDFGGGAQGDPSRWADDPPILGASATDANGITVVAVSRQRGANPDPTQHPDNTSGQGSPYWNGLQNQDWMYGVSDTGVTLWGFRVRDQIGLPYTLGASTAADPTRPYPQPDFAWDFNGSITVLGAGKSRSLWTGSVGGYKLFFLINNSDGSVVWHQDMRWQYEVIPVGPNNTIPGNFTAFGTFLGPDYRGHHYTVAAIAPNDDVWFALRDPHYGISGEVNRTLLVKLNATATATTVSIVSPNIDAATQLHVSSDGSQVILVGHNQGVGPLAWNWIETYSSAGVFVSSLSPGAIGVGPLSVCGAGQLGFGRKIWQVGTPVGSAANYSTWRQWSGNPNWPFVASLHADGVSVWGAGRIPATLGGDSSGSLLS